MWQRILRFLSWLFGYSKEVSEGALPEGVLESASILEPELDLASSDAPQYRKREYLFSRSEREFYRALLGAVGNEYHIFAKVRLADVLWLANEPENRKYHNNQIQCKHLDFVLCDKDRQRPLLAIELDDSSHKRLSRQASDEFKDSACAAAGLPLLRLQVQQTYSPLKIREQIRLKLREQTA